MTPPRARPLYPKATRVLRRKDIQRSGAVTWRWQATIYPEKARPVNMSRSISKHGEVVAYLMLMRRVQSWLLATYGERYEQMLYTQGQLEAVLRLTSLCEAEIAGGRFRSLLEEAFPLPPDEQEKSPPEGA